MRWRSPAGSAVLTALAGFALLAQSPAEAERRRSGEPVVIGGTVVDLDGEPVVGATVLLELSREHFSLRRFEKKTEEPLRLPVTSASDGTFRFDWGWDRHYNRFALAVGLEVTRGDRPDFEILQRQDITEQVLSGQPVNARLVLEDTGYLRWLQRFLNDRASEDEERVFREMGRPDRIEEGPLEGESSWWYFESGKSYRFAEGALQQVVPFDPVMPIE